MTMVSLLHFDLVYRRFNRPSIVIKASIVYAKIELAGSEDVIFVNMFPDDKDLAICSYSAK